MQKSNILVDLFHIGPQKSARTWVYKCLVEHPEVLCPIKDTIHYFDIFYTKGEKWYLSKFPNPKSSQKLFDPTFSYIRSPVAARRIYNYNPKAKIVINLRNPIERAFSHYWHEKKKGKYNFDFSEVLTNYDLFSTWIEPGFYAEHIRRYLRYFPREQILCLLFKDLEKDPESFLKKIFNFFDIDSSFKPSILKTKVNQAGHRQTFLYNSVNIIFRKINKVLPIRISPPIFISGKKEYKDGISEYLYNELYEIIEPEIIKLEKILNIDLIDWKK